MAIRLEFKSNSRQARQDLSQLERSVKGIDQNVAKASKGMNTLASAAKIAGAAFAGIFAAQQLTRVVDSFTLIENRIALVTGRTAELNKTFIELQQIGLRSRGSLEGIADLYNRLGRTTKQLGVTNEEILQVTETIQQAIAISGATAQSADAAIVQLGQGLAAGALRGQELNSVMEQTPRVASAIAAELGVGVGGLRKMAEQGKITSEVVVAAFQNQADVIQAEFNDVNATVGQGFAQVAINAKLVTREFIAGTGATDALANKLLSMAAGLNTLAPGAREAGEAFAAFFKGADGSESTLSNLVSHMKELGTDGVGYIKDLGSEIIRFSGGVLDSALSKIDSFVKAVNDGFFWVYDQVVGNSWWPDLIDEVVAYTDRIFAAVFKIESFTQKVNDAFVDALQRIRQAVSSAGNFLGDVFGDIILKGLSAVGIAKILGKNITTGALVSAALATQLIDGVAVGLDYLQTEFPKAFEALASVVAFGFLKRFTSGISVGIAAIGGLMSTGLIDPQDLAKTITESLELLGAGLGKIGGQLLAALPSFLVAFSIGLAKAAHQFGSAMLDQLGIIGDALRLLTLGSAPTMLGFGAVAVASILLIPEKVAKAVGIMMMTVKGAVQKSILFVVTTLGNLGKQGAAQELGAAGAAIFGQGGYKVFIAKTLASLKATGAAMRASLLTGGFRGKLFVGLADGIANFVGGSIRAAKSANAWVSAQGGLNAVLRLTLDNLAAYGANLLNLLTPLKAWYAQLVGAVAVNGALTASMLIQATVAKATTGLYALMSLGLKGLSAAAAIATNAFRVLALAIPVGPFVRVIGLISVLLSAFGPAAAEAANKIGLATNKIDYFSRGLSQLFGSDYSTINLVVEVEEASVQETFDSIAQINEELLYRMNRDADKFWLSDPTLGFDFARDLQTSWYIAVQNMSNTFYDFIGTRFNEVLDIVNSFRDNPIEFRFEENSSDISAVEHYLDQIDPTLRLRLDVEDEDLRFLSEDTLGEIVGLSATVANYRARIEELTNAYFLNSKARKESLEQLKGELSVYEQALNAQVDRAEIEARINKGSQRLAGTYKNFNQAIADTNKLLGEQVVRQLSLVDYNKLSVDEVRQYTDYQADIVELQEKIALAQVNGVLADGTRRTLTAEYIEQLEQVASAMLKLGTTAKQAGLLGSAQALGLSNTEYLKATKTELIGLRDAMQEIYDLEFKRASLEDGSSEADDVDRKIAQARLKAEKLAEGIDSSITSVFDKALAAFSEAGVNASLSDIGRLNDKQRQSVLDQASQLEALEAAVTEARDNGTAQSVAAAQLAYSKGAADIATSVEETFEESRRNIFEKVLKPFKDIGSTFGSEDFTKLGSQASAGLFARAQELGARYQELITDNEEKTAKERFAIVAKFNRELYEFEQEASRQRADAIKNETDAKNFAKGFADVITNALRGDASFGEGFVNLLLDNMTNALNDQIASFAQGFIESLLGGLDQSETAGSAAAGALKDIFFGPTEADKEGNRNDGKSLGDKLSGLLGFGGGQADNEAGGSAGVDAGSSAVVAAVTEQTDGLLGGFGDALGGLGDMFGGLLNNLGGLGSAAGGILSSLFGGMFDNGGSVPSGKFGIVGERGPELVSGPANVYNRAKTAREMDRAGSGGNNVTFNLEGDFDSRAERSIRNMVQSGMLQSSLNGAEIENGGAQPVFRTP